MFCQPHCVTSGLSERDRDRQSATATEAFIWSLLTTAMVRWIHSQITAWVCFASCSLTRPTKSQLTWAWVPWWAPWGSAPAPAAPWCAPPAGLESPLWSPAACQTTAHTDITVSLFVTCSLSNNWTHRHHRQPFRHLQFVKQLNTQTSPSAFSSPAVCQTTEHTNGGAPEKLSYIHSLSLTHILSLTCTLTHSLTHTHTHKHTHTEQPHHAHPHVETALCGWTSVGLQRAALGTDAASPR